MPCSKASAISPSSDETEIALLGIGREFQKPTVFEMRSVEDNLLLALKCSRTRACSDQLEAQCRMIPPCIDRILDIIRLQASPLVAWLVRSVLARNNGVEIAPAAWSGTQAVCWLTNLWPNMTDAETMQTAELLQGNQPREECGCGLARHAFRCAELGVKVTCLHEGSVLAEGSIDQVSTNERVVEVYLGGSA